MKTLVSAILALAAAAVPASAINVTAPAQGAQVSSPFTVSANTSVCGSVPAVSMGYSLDAGSAVVEPTSFAASVTATPGNHVLHIKCWGKQTSDQVLVNINVVAPASNGSGFTVSSPADGSDLTSPFTVAASATTCGSLPALSLSYAIDGKSSALLPTTFSTTASANPGKHVLTVKCIGLGATTQTSLNIHVVVPPAASTPRFSLASGQYSTRQAVALTNGTPGATIYYTLDGSGPSTSSLRYTGPIAITGTMTIEAMAVAPGYSTSGLARADYAIVAPKSAPVPSNAIKQNDIQLLPDWRIKHDPATPGSATGQMTLVSNPSLSGQAQEFYTTYTNGGGLLYSLTYGNDPDAKNFVYDAQVWIASGSQIINLEMDNNQVIANGDTVIYAFQCSGNTNTWEYTSNAGTPSNPIVKWNRSTAACNPANWAPDTWHHVQISYSRDDDGNVTYHSAWLDGVEEPINATVNSAFSLGWANGALVTNFQVDGTPKTDGEATLYLDNLTINRW